MTGLHDQCISFCFWNNDITVQFALANFVRLTLVIALISHKKSSLDSAVIRCLIDILFGIGKIIHAFQQTFTNEIKNTKLQFCEEILYHVFLSSFFFCLTSAVSACLPRRLPSTPPFLREYEILFFFLSPPSKKSLCHERIS